ncbi:hypothetical protein PM082_007219 [Marasmius tenuissimus]|nr:hypothetical protein PM082_007219 [Marasmius tenuissimus]
MPTNSFTELSSVDSSFSSSTRTTIPGIGYLSGKAIQRLGEVILNRADVVLVNRRLRRIEASIATNNGWRKPTPSEDVVNMCELLLELLHPGYPFSIRTRTMRIVMALISSMNFAGLATALVSLKSTAMIQNHLCEVLDCLWDSKSSKRQAIAVHQIGAVTTLLILDPAIIILLLTARSGEKLLRMQSRERRLQPSGPPVTKLMFHPSHNLGTLPLPYSCHRRLYSISLSSPYLGIGSTPA